MSKFHMQIETEYPILFLSDSSPNARIPEEAGHRIVTSSSDCVAFCVMSYVDGASMVTVSDKECDEAGGSLFEGSIDAPSGVLTVSDSDGFAYLRVPVPNGSVSIKLSADEVRNPEWVWIQLGSIRSY